MRITKRSIIAVQVLMYCADNDGGLVTKSEIASYYDVSENHMALVIHQLSQLGFLHTQRGRNGGITLGRPAKDIQIGNVLRELESPVEEFECLVDVDKASPTIDGFRLKTALADAAEVFYEHLDGITLYKLICCDDPLQKILPPANFSS